MISERRLRLAARGLIAAAVLGAGAWLAAQEIDPFYLKALADGETQFQSKAYAQAAASFEIAAFGLHPRPAVLGRARLLLGLCRGYLNDRAGAEAQIKAAYTLLGADGLAQAEIPDSARADLLRLLKLFKLDSPAAVSAPSPRVEDKPSPPPPSKTESKPAPKEAAPVVPAASTPPAAVSRDDRAGLERRIREAPRDPAAYYELAALDETSGDLKSAARLFQDLLAKAPAEIRAVYEIGRIRYRERSLKDAEKSLERFLTLAADVPAAPVLVASARAYLALSAYLRGDAAKAQKVLRQGPAWDKAAVESLGLAADDRDRLNRLLGR